jgi:hypothetical protein
MIQSPPKGPTSEHCCIGVQAFNSWALGTIMIQTIVVTEYKGIDT